MAIYAHLGIYFCTSLEEFEWKKVYLPVKIKMSEQNNLFEVCSDDYFVEILPVLIASTFEIRF